MLSECIYTSGGGGGSITASQLSVAGKTPIYTITTRGATLQIEEDCVMAGFVSTTQSNNSAKVYIDGSELVYTTGTLGIGTTDGTSLNSYGIFIPKGVTITTRNVSVNSYNLKFFPLN